MIYNVYSNSDLLDSLLSFVIPIYENMPELPSLSPAISESDFEKDNTEVFANVQTTLNVRTGPGTSYEVLTSLQAGEEMTRIAKGKQKGELWDRVKLQNGMVGFVFREYVEEVPEIEIDNIELSVDKSTITKGEKIKLNIKIEPENTPLNAIKLSSEDENVATVSSDGYILGVKSGETKIYAKAKNGVSDFVNIKVITPLTDIVTSLDTYIIQEGETINLNPMLVPDDADNQEITYLSQNEDIATVTNQGIVTGMKIGTATIQISGDNNVSKTIKINVIIKLEDDEIRFDEALNVSNNIISGLENKNNTVEKIKNKITTNYTVEIYNKNGEKIEGKSLVGTGSKIKILDGQNTIIEYDVVLYGDVNGDGKINSIDLLVLQRHILEIEKLKNIYVKAGNVRKNNKNPSSVDCLLIQRYILGIQNLEQ